MIKPLYIHSFSNFYQPIDQLSGEVLEQELPNLKPLVAEACGKKIRRIDRLTQLALIGSFSCKAGHNLPEMTGLYMSSMFGSLNNSREVLADIYCDHELPRPLNFINTVGNAACFYLAQQLQLQAVNQFVVNSRFAFEALLHHASIDLDVGNIDAALLGVVSEVDSILLNHHRRLGIDEQLQLAEGSHWLLLSHDNAEQQALAKVTQISLALSFEAMMAELQRLASQSSLQICFADATSSANAAQKTVILESVAAFNVSEVDFAVKNSRHEFSSVMQITGYLAACKDNAVDKPLLYLNQNKAGQWSLLCLQAC
jgi:hypothetical protein